MTLMAIGRLAITHFRQAAMRNVFYQFFIALLLFASCAVKARATSFESRVKVRFVQSSEKVNHQSTRYDSWQWKNWTSSESDQVNSVLESIYKQHPGLLKAASVGNELAFVRVRNINEKRSPKLSAMYQNDPVAAAGPDFVFIGDRFFQPKLKFYQLHGLAHELVHLIDYGDYISYSPEWVNFAQPKMNRLYNALSAEKPDYRSSLEAVYRKGGICPTTYATSELREALAEYWVAYEFEDFEPGEYFKTKFADSLLTPSQEHIDYRNHCLSGIKFLDGKQYGKALEQFRLAETIAPNAPSVQGNLSKIYQEQADHEACFESAAKGLRLLVDLGVSNQDPYYKYFEDEGKWAYWYVFYDNNPQNRVLGARKMDLSPQSLDDFCSGKSNQLQGYDTF